MEDNEKAMVGLSMIKVGPWNAIVYQEMTRKQQEELIEHLSEEAACHADDCPWWRDWHACSCGAFDQSSPSESSSSVS